MKAACRSLFVFDTHGGDTSLNARSGQEVTIVRRLTDVDEAEVGPMYRVMFPDGRLEDAFEDELTPTPNPEDWRV